MPAWHVVVCMMHTLSHLGGVPLQPTRQPAPAINHLIRVVAALLVLVAASSHTPPAPIVLIIHVRLHLLQVSPGCTTSRVLSRPQASIDSLPASSEGLTEPQPFLFHRLWQLLLSLFIVMFPLLFIVKKEILSRAAGIAVDGLLPLLL